MALPDIYAMALEAQAVAQSAAEVLGRLSTALCPSNQLMGVWVQERDARQQQLEQQLAAGQEHDVSNARERLVRMEQLDSQVQELGAALDSVHANRQAEQNSINAKIEHLLQHRSTLKHQQHQQLHEQWKRRQQQSCVVAHQGGVVRCPHQPSEHYPGCAPQQRQAAADGQSGSPGSDSDASLPPSQPQLRVERVPETCFVAWADACDPGEAVAQQLEPLGARLPNTGAVVTGDAAQAPGESDWTRLPAAGLRSGADHAAAGQEEMGRSLAGEDLARAQAAAAEALWASREQELTQDYAAQLQAVWAENKALQADLQSALGYRRLAQQLRGSNQALQQQLQDCQQQLQELRDAAAAAAAQSPAVPQEAPPAGVSVATSPPPCVLLALRAPEHGADDRRRLGAAVAPPLAAAAADGSPRRTEAAFAMAEEAGPSAGGAAAPRAEPPSVSAGESPSARAAKLVSERDKYICRYRDAKQACRDAKQLARHWQSAYWGLVAAHEGPEAAQGAKGAAGCTEAALGNPAMQAEPKPGEGRIGQEEEGDAGACAHEPDADSKDGGDMQLDPDQLQPGSVVVKEEGRSEDLLLAPAAPSYVAVYDGTGGRAQAVAPSPRAAPRGDASLAEAACRRSVSHRAGGAHLHTNQTRRLPHPTQRPSPPHGEGCRDDQGLTPLGAAGAEAGAQDQVIVGAARRGDAVGPAVGAVVALMKPPASQSAGGEGGGTDDEMDLTQEPSEGGLNGCGFRQKDRRLDDLGHPQPHQQQQHPHPHPQQQQPQQQQQPCYFEGGPRQPGVNSRHSDGSRHRHWQEQGPPGSVPMAGGTDGYSGGTGGRARGALRRDNGSRPYGMGGEMGAGEDALRLGAAPAEGRRALARASDGGGWLNKRSRSWDSLDSDGGAGTDGGRAADGRAGGAGQAGPSRSEKAPLPGRRYVQQQLPFGRQRQDPQDPDRQQQRRQRQQIRQPWHLAQGAPTSANGPAIDTSLTVDAACNGGAGVTVRDSKLVGSDTDQELAGGDGGVAAAQGGRSDAERSDGGAAAPLPPLKRMALEAPGGAPAPGGSRAGLTSVQPGQQGGATGRPPKAPLAQQLTSEAPTPGGNAVPAAAAMGELHAVAAVGVNGRDEPGYKYTAVVRGRAERETLMAVECTGCKAFYEAVATWGDAMAQPCCNHARERVVLGNAGGGGGAAAMAAAGPAEAQPLMKAIGLASELRQAGGRHRFKYAPPATPEGFWDIGFGDTQN